MLLPAPLGPTIAVSVRGRSSKSTCGERGLRRRRMVEGHAVEATVIALSAGVEAEVG